MRFLIDAHLDIAWNAIGYDRPQTWPVAQTRQYEKTHAMQGEGRGENTTSLPAMRDANIGICLATILSRTYPTATASSTASSALPSLARTPNTTTLRDDIDFSDPLITSAYAQSQLAYYRLLEQAGEMTPITCQRTFDQVYNAWHKKEASQTKPPIGYIMSMEGADPIFDIDQLQWWWDAGLRTLCLAHYGQALHAMGTGDNGPLTSLGQQLVKKMDELGIILDLVHTADLAIDEALDIYTKPVFVSHANCRALVDNARQITDQQIKAIAARQGVVGVVCSNAMIKPRITYQHDASKRPSLVDLANHIDYICQLTGSCNHVGIGSDLDGGFGKQDSPRDLDTIVDLHQLANSLAARNYSDKQIDQIFHHNWARFFRDNLPP